MAETTSSWRRFNARRWRRYLRSPDGTAMLAALGSLVLLLLAVGSLSQWYRGRLISERRGQVAAELSLRGNALSAAINRRMALLDGLVAFVHVNAGHPLFDERFETYAAEIYTSAEGVRNIAMAPGGVVQNIYPLVGNQLVLGFDISTDPRPEVRQSVERAISTGEIVLIGPLDLVQGGQGLIARKAVFREGSYWGLVNLVIDAMPVLHRAGITEQAGGLSLALRNRDGAYLYGSAQVAELDPVTNPIQLPGDDWDLLAAPERGWEAAVRQDLLFFQISGSAIALLLVGLVYLSVNRQVWLARSVQERTRQISRINARLQEDIAQRKQAEASLSEREEQYRGVFETVRDGLFINSLEGELLAFNPAAHEMHGYSAEEFAKLRPEAFIHPDDLHFFFDCIHSVRVGNTYRCRARDIRKDGSIFYVEVFGSPFTYRGEPATLAVVRDISEQVEYAHTLELRVEERTRTLVTLFEISQNVISSKSLDLLLDQIIDQLQQILEFTGASVFTLDDGVLSARAYRGPLSVQEVLSLRVRLAESALDREILRRREPIIIPDVRADDPLARSLQRSLGDGLETKFAHIRSWMGVPLIVKDRVIGNLVFDHEVPGYYQIRHARLAQAFANQAAVAIENARLYEQAQQLASLQERQKLARELHDSVSQALYGIALGARTAQSILERSGPDDQTASMLQESLDYVMSLADAGLTEMRALIFELRPESLETEGLVAALAKQATSLRARHQLAVETHLDGEPDVSMEVKESLYRVAQEALHNTVKHARAGQVSLGLWAGPDALVLEIRDDGRGFETDREYPGHLGLRSMQERVARLGGTLEIQSAPGAGTTIKAVIPG